MRCSGCEQDKPEEAFSFRNKARGIRLKRCKACQAETRAKHYEANKSKLIAKQRETNKATRERNRRFVYEYLLEHPCQGEGCSEDDPVVLEFDHLDRSTKKAAVSQLVNDHASLEVLAAEIAKCVVLCANCHRRKTAAERGYFAFRMKGSA